MVSYQRPFCPAKHCDGKDYFKRVLCADYASGKNTIGGGGLGIYYYFTPDISILTGPDFSTRTKLMKIVSGLSRLTLVFLYFLKRIQAEKNK